MKSQLLSAFLVLFLLLLALPCVSLGRTWSPGVAEGDFFYYEMYGVYTSSDPNAVIDVPPFERNNTDWVRVNVTGVSGSVVNQVYTFRFKNGTESQVAWSTNLAPDDLGEFDIREKGIPICAANLSVGDPLPEVNLSIAATLNRDYLGAAREVNYVSWNVSDDHGYCYFDRRTGVLVELCRVHLYVNSVTGETISKTDVVNITSSNLWQVPAQPDLFLPSLLAAIVGGGIAFFIIKHRLARSRRDVFVKKP